MAVPSSFFVYGGQAYDAVSVLETLAGTSTTSLTISTGSKTLTTQENLEYTDATFVVIASRANNTNYMHGQVTSYSGTTLVVNVLDTGGSGTHADWDINISAPQGPQGATGPQGPAGSGGGGVAIHGTPTANHFTTWYDASTIQDAGTPSGTLLDNLTGFSATGLLKRTGAGAYSFVTLAFSDITGTVGASQLPNPGATTLGGIKSNAGTAHQWIAAINTDGTVTLSQPAFSDISGSLAGSQTPAYTGDVTKSSGSTTTVLANIPNDVPMAGDLLVTATAAPSTPAAGKGRAYVDSTQKVWSHKSDAGTVSITIVPSSAASHQWASAISAAGVVTWTQPAFTDVSGVLGSTQHPALTGDVTCSSGSTTTTLANIPSATPMAGSLLATAIAAPSTPAAGKASIYVDSTNKVLAVKNDAGTVSSTVQPSSAGSHQFATAVSAAGAITWTQPAFTDISGTATYSQLPASAPIAAIQFVIDGGGSTITTGLKGYLEVPFACTINQATLLADASGSIVVNVWKCTYAQFDAGGTHPVAADKITASAPPTISTATKAQDATLTGWTTSISAGDILAFNVDSVTTIKRVTLDLKVTKT